MKEMTQKIALSILVVIILFTVSSLKAQSDPLAHARITKNTIKIMNSNFKISKNKFRINQLKSTVKSEMRAANRKLETGNEKREEAFEEDKEFHKYMKDEIDKEKTINVNIMTTSFFKNIRNTYKGVRKARNELFQYIDNVNAEIVANDQQKLIKTGMESIVDEAKVIYEQFDILKSDNKMKMNDGDRLESLKQLKAELDHIQRLAIYWKNRSIQSMELSMKNFQQNQSMNHLLGK